MSNAIRKLAGAAIAATLVLGAAGLAVAQAPSSSSGAQDRQPVPPTTPTQTTTPTQPSLTQSVPEQRRPERPATDDPQTRPSFDRMPAPPTPPSQPEGGSAAAPMR